MFEQFGSRMHARSCHARLPLPCAAAEYPLLMGLLRQRTHKEQAGRIVHNVLDAGTRLSTPDKVAMLFRCATPI